MPWTYDDPPAVSLTWSAEEQRRCVDAANAVLERGGDDQEAIFACIHAAGKGVIMETKTYKAHIELKSDGEPGEFKAVFSTFNVIDHDEDVTLPGAFEEQSAAVEPWNHGWTLPAGRGVIKANEKEAWMEGRFFLDTEVGKENYQTVKNMGELAEWSYTFDIKEWSIGEFEDREVRFLKKLDVVGVSPVTRGAGIDTRTMMIKTKDPEKQQPENEDETGNGKSSEVQVMRTRIQISEVELLEKENEDT